MTELIRILHLEDSTRDAELAERQLRAEGLHCAVTRAERREAFEAALAGKPFDLILCDYQVPGYDGMAAIRLARRQCPDVPLIVLTGTLGDELAVECLRSGATDYVLKQHLDRLVPVVQRALREAEERGQRLAAEESLRESEERIRLLLDSTAEAIFGVDMHGHCTFCNAASLRLLFYSDPCDLLGRNMHDVIHHSHPDSEPFPQESCPYIAALRRGDSMHNDEEVLWRADGTSFPAEYWSYPVRRDGQFMGAVVTFFDITDRKRAENELRDSRERLRKLARQVLAAQETERRRLARELHDEIGQVLTAISINLHMVKRGCGDAALPAIEEGLGIIDRAIQQVRGMSLDLRPPMLDDLGLLAALRWYLDRQSRLDGFEVHLGIPQIGPRFPTELETTCFRVTQEAVTNVLRHSQAKNIWVELWHDAETLYLTIDDDGVGFDLDEVRQRAARGASFGLSGMRERVELMGGQFAVVSEPGNGTTIDVCLPLTPAEEAGH